jgi:ribulose 1,5-bisphosphate carboxylase large subunit-like protein
MISLSLQGVNEDVDAGTEDVTELGATYTGMPVFPTQAGEALNIVSSSAADAAAGTGQRTIKIVGLDANGASQEETVTLNVTTPVVTSSTWTRVHRVFGVTAGSGGTNAGAITVKHNVTTANVFAVMKAGRSQSMLGVYTVPAGRTARVVSWGGQVMARPTGTNQGWRVLRVLALPAVPTTKVLDKISGDGLKLSALTDVKINFISATANSFVAADLNIEVSGS